MPPTIVENTVVANVVHLTNGPAVTEHRDPVRISDDRAATACAALELMEHVCGAATLQAASVDLVNRMRSFLGADGVALGLVKGGRCRLAAIAGTAQINPASDLSAAVQVTLDRTYEAVRRGDDPEISADARGADAIADEPLRKILIGAAVDMFLLTGHTHMAVGALVIWGREPSFDRAQSQRFIRFAGEPLARALDLLNRAQYGHWRRGFRKALGSRRGLTCALVAAIAALVMLLLPYRITLDCAAEPLKRRFVAAPFAGVLEKSLVRPGDVVAKDELLGRMDGRELRIELAGVTADFERVRKSYDVNLAAGKVAAAQIDKLEQERLDQQRQLLAHRTANLEIRSPVAGFVISGDPERTEGAALTIGQVLYEIAPLEAMIVEIAIDDDEIAQVAVGQTVSIHFDAHPNDAFEGRLARIHPRSETRDSRNVFIGEVLIEDAKSTLRPGMKGKARIELDGESLGGGLFRRGWHAVERLLGF
jgi:biotin carboxyl carrier protein